MSSLIGGNPYVWTIIRENKGNEEYVGQHDADSDISFIPAFLIKDEALKGYHIFKKEVGWKYEVQAVRFSELLKDARSNHFMIFILDGDGKILEKINPAETL